EHDHEVDDAPSHQARLGQGVRHQRGHQQAEEGAADGDDRRDADGAEDGGRGEDVTVGVEGELSRHEQEVGGGELTGGGEGAADDVHEGDHAQQREAAEDDHVDYPEPLLSAGQGSLCGLRAPALADRRRHGRRGAGGGGGRGRRGGHGGLPSVTGRRAKKPAATKNRNATGKRISWLPRSQARPAAAAHQPAPRRQGRRRARNRAITDSSSTATRVTPNQAARVSASRRASTTGTPASAPTSAGITTCSNVTSSMRFMASTNPPIATKDTAIPIPT